MGVIPIKSHTGHASNLSDGSCCSAAISRELGDSESAMLRVNLPIGIRPAENRNPAERGPVSNNRYELLQPAPCGEAEAQQAEGEQRESAGLGDAESQIV